MTAAACLVTRLRLYQFRNYAETTVRFGPGLNVISGSNAQGKTNLLEAVATLALTRSPRAVSAADLVQWGRDGCQIEADIQRPGGVSEIATRFERVPGDTTVSRRTTLDGKPRAARAVLGVCPVVLFWPDDLQLVKAGPDGRRRLLDVLLSQVDSHVAVHLVRYRRVLEQRNALLHSIRATGGSPASLVGFTRELAHHGSRIIVARRHLVDELAPLATAALNELSSGQEQLVLRYLATHGAPATDDDGTERDLLAALEARASEELARGMTVIGPHRDDLEFELDGRPARYTASQGQQRSIVLACKIAEMRYLSHAAGMSPVVLLDDVVSELDEQRRRDLLATLAATPSQQVLMTSTERLDHASMFAAVQHFNVRSGTVTAA